MGIKKRYVLLLVLFLFHYLHLLNIVPLLLDRHEGEGGAYINDGGDRDGRTIKQDGKEKVRSWYFSRATFVLFSFGILTFTFVLF